MLRCSISVPAPRKGNFCTCRRVVAPHQLVGGPWGQRWCIAVRGPSRGGGQEGHRKGVLAPWGRFGVDPAPSRVGSIQVNLGPMCGRCGVVACRIDFGYVWGARSGEVPLRVREGGREKCVRSLNEVSLKIRLEPVSRLLLKHLAGATHRAQRGRDIRLTGGSADPMGRHGRLWQLTPWAAPPLP